MHNKGVMFCNQCDIISDQCVPGGGGATPV